jgi:putative alpha-1,2-mannosidase
MEMIEQSQQIFGLIAKLGSRETFATMGIKTATTNLHREEARQERRGEKVVTNDPKYHENYVWKFSVVLAGNECINE